MNISVCVRVEWVMYLSILTCLLNSVLSACLTNTLVD